MATASSKETRYTHHTIRFSTGYYTQWGERVVVVGSHPVLVRGWTLNLDITLPP